MLIALVAALWAGHGYGPVTPRELPSVTVTRHDGVRLPLRRAVGQGRVAVQFVFTECQTVCPLLGSLFRQADRTLAGGSVQLVSISVNPAGDTPARLASWLAQFGASPRWIALRVERRDLPALLAVFGETDPAPAAHSKQIYFVERGRYAARSTELPRASLVAAVLRGAAPIAGLAAARQEREAAPLDSMRGRMGDDLLTAEASRCANCHGAGGAGGSEGRVSVPALSASSLTNAVARRGGPASRYTSESFCAVLRTGVDPAGVVLSAVMPRYELSDDACGWLWRSVTEPR